MSPVPAIAVCGASRTDDPKILEQARRLGAAVMRAGCTLVSGGRDGVMHAACEGAAVTRAAEGRGGTIVAILPSRDKAEANPFCDVVIPTGLGYARNSVVVLSGDAVILVGGGSGTLSEAAYAWQFGKPIVALVPTGGWAARLAGTTIDDRRTDQVWAAHDPDEAVRRALQLIGGRPG